jgi:hypothetical protein
MIQMYENVVPENFCNHLIQKFESETDLDKRFDVFDQLEIQHWKEETSILVDACKELYENYSQVFDPLGMMPKTRKIESVRLKRYTPNKHRFPLHVDVGYSGNCSRYLAFLIYLNDNEAGTKFYSLNEEHTFEAKRGNILVFPPTWFFPHEGLMPTKTTKYIASTYFHYI